MTSIAKTARAALVVAVLALTTAGAASADVWHPDPFQSTGVATHPDPGRVQSTNPGAIRTWDYARPATGRGWSHLVLVRPNFPGCYPRCLL